MDRRDALKQISALVGGVIALPIANGFLAARSVASPPPRGAPITWAPASLNAHQNELVTTIAELIIPQTNTPGAKAARVNQFVDLIVSTGFNTEEKDRFFAGMLETEAFCKEKYGRDFSVCSQPEQTKLLLALEEEFRTSGEISLRANFFNMMKQFTLVGYYTSEIGATQELRKPVMGYYPGCTPFDGTEAAWAW